MARIHPTTVQFCCPLAPTLPLTASRLGVRGPLGRRDHRVPRAPLPGGGVTHRQGGLRDPSRALLLLRRSYGPMRQSNVLSPPWWSLGRSLCRLLPSPAGRGTFPTLSPESVWRRLDPYPAVSPRCLYPFLPWGRRPHVTGKTFGTRENPCDATSTGSRISGLQSFADVQSPPLARPPVAPTAGRRLGGRAVYTTHRPGGYPRRDVVSLRVRIWAFVTAGLAPARFQPCRLLPPLRALTR